jgi:cyclohexyl-isocyanide hydratase
VGWSGREEQPVNARGQAGTNFQAGFLVFPGVQLLDLAGPLEVFGLVPGVRLRLIWKALELIPSSSGVLLKPSDQLGSCPQLDLLCVPGGPGIDPLLGDKEVLEFVRKQAEGVEYLTSVCTGALLLGTAGLLRGYRATTHWSATALLPSLGATYQSGRVVEDRNRVTAGGVTAGIDFGLRLVAKIWGEDQAQRVQLRLEYRPDPPFQAGHPDTAPRRITEQAEQELATRRERRAELLRKLLDN